MSLRQLLDFAEAQDALRLAEHEFRVALRIALAHGHADELRILTGGQSKSALYRECKGVDLRGVQDERIRRRDDNHGSQGLDRAS